MSLFSRSVRRATPRYLSYPTIRPRITVRNMQIKTIPMWVGKGNNYAYIVIDDATKDAVVIDPANPPEVLPVLKEGTDKGDFKLKAIYNTHHHWDHAGGNEEILKHYPVEVIGGRDCAKVTKTPQHMDTWYLGEKVKFGALHTPCHTQDSICFFAEEGPNRAVFTGDTLFIGGCGRFFEGNAGEMNAALNEILASLPHDTYIFPGHEYTKQNVKFAMSVLQSEAIKKLHAFAEENEETTGKVTIGEELEHNVFMRVKDPAIQKLTGESDPVAVMAKLREMKNNS